MNNTSQGSFIYTHTFYTKGKSKIVISLSKQRDMAPPCGMFTKNADQTLKSSPHMSNEIIINISE